MVVINKVKYESYLEVCNAFDISYVDLIKYRQINAGISELELLGHFINNIAYRVDIGEYVIV